MTARFDKERAVSRCGRCRRSEGGLDMADATTPTNAPAPQRAGSLAVRIVTPERVLVDTTADAIELPAQSGYMEALYGAAPLLAELGAGEVRLHGGNSGEAKFFVAWGFVEVLPQRVTVLAETAMKPSEIDPAQAQQAAGRCAEGLERGWRRRGEVRVCARRDSGGGREAGSGERSVAGVTPPPVMVAKGTNTLGTPRFMECKCLILQKQRSEMFVKTSVKCKAQLQKGPKT